MAGGSPVYVRPSWIKFQVFVIGPLLALNLLCAWAVDDYRGGTEAVRMTPLPAGSVYLDTCDGRPTQSVGAVGDGCLADYPGEQGQVIVLGFSLVGVVLANLGYGVLSAVRRRERGPDGVPVTADS